MKTLRGVSLLFKNGDVAEIQASAIDYLQLDNFKRSYVWSKNDLTGLSTSKSVLSVGSIDLIIDCEAIKGISTQFGKGLQNRILKLNDIDHLHTILYLGEVDEYHLGWNPTVGMSVGNPNQYTVYTGDKIKIKWRFCEDMPCTKTEKNIAYY